jgi:hypothetical protein
MPERVLLTLDRRSFHALWLRAGKGDEEASAELAALWNEYSDRSLVCFLCDGDIIGHPFTMMFPEYK